MYYTVFYYSFTIKRFKAELFLAEVVHTSLSKRINVLQFLVKL